VPFALLGLLVASMFLRQPFYRVALVAQLGFYLLSLAAWGEIKLAAVAAGGCGAHVRGAEFAALVAFVNFVTGRKAVWVR